MIYKILDMDFREIDGVMGGHSGDVTIIVKWSVEGEKRRQYTVD